MNQSQFQKGNYNEWCSLVKKALPNTDITLRKIFLPKLEGALKSMLGSYADFNREEINAYPFIEKDFFKGVCIEISYIVEDFHVQNIPEDAVTSDEKALAEYLLENKIKIQELKIDTTTGELKIKAVFLFEEETEV